MQAYDFTSHLSALVESEIEACQGSSLVINQAPLVKFQT